MSYNPPDYEPWDERIVWNGLELQAADDHIVLTDVRDIARFLSELAEWADNPGLCPNGRTWIACRNLHDIYRNMRGLPCPACRNDIFDHFRKEIDREARRVRDENRKYAGADDEC